MDTNINISKVAKKIKELNLSENKLAEVYTSAKITIKLNNGIDTLFRDCKRCPFHTILKNGASVPCSDIVESLFGIFEISCYKRLSLLIHVMDSRRAVINGRFTKI